MAIDLTGTWLFGVPLGLLGAFVLAAFVGLSPAILVIAAGAVGLALQALRKGADR